MPKRSSEKIKKNIDLETQVYDISGSTVGKIELPKEIFGASINKFLLAQAVRVYLADQRSGTHKAKTRSEVIGSTRKIYRQKGTGRARHGDIKAPIFIGGGAAHGPRPRDYSLSFSKKMKRLALFSALSDKYQTGKIKVITGLESIEPRTKIMHGILKNLNYINKNNDVTDSLLLITKEKIENIFLSGRNIEKVTIMPARFLNTYEVLKNKSILITKDATLYLENYFGKKEEKEEKIMKKDSDLKTMEKPMEKVEKKVSKTSKTPKPKSAKKNITKKDIKPKK